MTENNEKNVNAVLNNPQAALAALSWYVDSGVDEVMGDTPIDRTAVPDVKATIAKAPPPKAVMAKAQAETAVIMNTNEAVAAATKLAAACDTLDALRTAIEGFDGLSIKKTATNMVFADGNPDADIMLIGEAAGADEDIQGTPFVGESGQLLDKILACIGLSRDAEDMSKAVYISNILNWRPPGNRTPTAEEVNIALPFITRHIALAQPKMLIICGGVAGKALLKSTDSISKLRGKFHDYQGAQGNIPALVTYHPTYLLRTPSQKKAVWADMLMLEERLKGK